MKLTWLQQKTSTATMRQRTGILRSLMASFRWWIFGLVDRLGFQIVNQPWICETWENSILFPVLNNLKIEVCTWRKGLWDICCFTVVFGYCCTLGFLNQASADLSVWSGWLRWCQGSSRQVPQIESVNTYCFWCKLFLQQRGRRVT